MEMLQLHAAKREDEDLPIVLQVYTREDQIRPEVAKKCKKWSDAAYAGDWDTIMSVSRIACFTDDDQRLYNAATIE